ncbi:MAG: hypothetical protein JSW38_09980 [Dehalococcoidia bacterium]|nr:MAG: hypothetical protein JSW38_09980 [Dehalococcoidia bacterium]
MEVDNKEQQIRNNQEQVNIEKKRETNQLWLVAEMFLNRALQEKQKFNESQSKMTIGEWPWVSDDSGHSVSRQHDQPNVKTATK